MSALPYLHDSKPDVGQRAVEMEDETFPLSYQHVQEKEEFVDLQGIAHNPDNLMPPSHVRLTWRLVSIREYIYDTEKGL